MGLGYYVVLKSSHNAMDYHKKTWCKQLNLRDRGPHHFLSQVRISSSPAVKRRTNGQGLQ